MSKAQTKPAKNFREFERENEDVKKGEHIKLPLSRIKIRPGFNPRDLKKPETQTKIDGIQLSYETDGHVPMILVRMSLDGQHVEIIDGECRFTAAVRADAKMRKEGGKGIEFLECERFSGTDVEATVVAFRSAQAETLLPLEQSNSVVDLQKQGLNREQIAVELQKSIGWIDRLIVISKLPKDVKDLVKAGKIAAETAVSVVKKHGAEDAAQIIIDKLNGAEAKGETKVTTKHTKDDGGEEGETSAKVKPAKKSETKQFAVARDLAFALPDKITKVRTIAEDKDYEITLSGAALKLLLALQDGFAAEIDAAVKAERAASKKAA